ncbi:MAG TPA: SAF domain-containing protein [Microbacterium sp.]|nr:SAF domain-containing protein [Microbacterium sp.]
MTTHTRVRRTPWGDARFYIGIALVALSIIGVWLIVNASRSTVPVLRADRTITQGEALSSSDFSVVDVSLGAVSDGYLSPQDLTAGQIATRSMAQGELLSSAAVGDAADARTTTLVVESSVGLPAGIEAGTVVELWQAPPLEDGFDEPRILVADVTVASLVETEGMMAQDHPAVELVIDRSDVSDVLSAITGGAALSVVPMGSR